MKPAMIDVRIDTLVLEGTPIGSPQAVRAAIERELAVVLADQGLPGALSDGMRVDRLQGEPVSLPGPPGSPASLRRAGRGVALAIQRGIAR